jgi:peptidoglycan-associated lipoprotein
MSRILRTLAATTALGLAALAMPTVPARAAGPYDGTWIIDVPADIISAHGDPTCPALRLRVQITDSQLYGNFRRSDPEMSNVVENGGRSGASQVFGSVQPDGTITAQWQNFHAAGQMMGQGAGLTVQSECGPLHAKVWRLDGVTMTTASAASTVGSGSSQAASTATANDGQRLFNVYFNFDRSRLGDKGEDVVKAAAQATLQDRTGRVELVGKADLSGTDPYNMALSQRRADRVRDALVASGVPADRIDTRWDGDRQPPVPTAAGVRDAQNRVVEVAFQ